jgi:hypothetical protein
MSKSGWSRKFDEPIPLPKGRPLVTLKDAGTYITELPKAEHMAPEWQAAMEALILVARRRPDDAGTHRRHEGFAPTRGSRIQSIAQGNTLGKRKLARER